jgi:hypothetical protein
VRRVVVDANVLLSFIVDRDEKQRAAAKRFSCAPPRANS